MFFQACFWYMKLLMRMIISRMMILGMMIFCGRVKDNMRNKIPKQKDRIRLNFRALMVWWSLE